MLLPSTSLFDFLFSLYCVESHLVSMALTIRSILMTVTSPVPSPDLYLELQTFISSHLLNVSTWTSNKLSVLMCLKHNPLSDLLPSPLPHIHLYSSLAW